MADFSGLKMPVCCAPTVDYTRRDLLKHAALAPALLALFASARAVSNTRADVSYLSRFACARTDYRAEGSEVHFLTVVGAHHRDKLRQEVESLSYDSDSKIFGHVSAQTWSICDSHVDVNASLGLIVLLDTTPTSLRAAVEEASEWLMQGLRVYLAVPSAPDAVYRVLEAMAGREGPWQVVRCKDSISADPITQTSCQSRLVSELVRALLEPNGNYCFPCLDFGDWHAVLSGRLVDLFCFTAPTLAAIEARLLRTLESSPLSTPVVLVVTGPIEFESIKLRYRPLDLLYKFDPPECSEECSVFAANGSDHQVDYSMYLLRSTPLSELGLGGLNVTDSN